MFDAALPRLGGLDILVNNAGILIEKPLLETSAADFDRLIGVNLRGVFLVGREAIRVMARQGGRPSDQRRLRARLSRPRELLGLLRLQGRRAVDDPLLGARVRARNPGQRDRPGPTDTPMLGPSSTSAETLAKEAMNPLGRIAPPGGDRGRGRVPRRAGCDLHDRPVRQPERRRGDVLAEG